MQGSTSPQGLVPPFNLDSATRKVRMAEDAWNTRDPERVSLAYTVDSQWRNRSEFINGRAQLREFLARKWSTELDYRLVKRLGIHRKSHRGSLSVRVARPGRPLVSQLRQ